MRIRLDASGDTTVQTIRLTLTTALGDHDRDGFDVAVDRCSSFVTTCSVDRAECTKLLNDIGEKNCSRIYLSAVENSMRGDVPPPSVLPI